MRWPPPLRTRAMVAFGGLAAVLSTVLCVVCYQLTRATLTSQRERVAERQTYVNARAVDNALTRDPKAPAAALADAQTAAQGFAVLRTGGRWYASSVTGEGSDVPQSLLDVVEDGDPARQRIRIDGRSVVAVGVPIASSAGPTIYVEFVPMGEVAASLNRVRQGLILAAVASTIAGLLAGRWASGRILRPVRRTAEAANLIAAGALDRRLESDGDADLDPLVDSFNEMVDGLQFRIEREARFASDVSHELRTPLAAMLSALSVARRRVKEPAGVEALDLLQHEVDRFTRLLTDLLEISRVEAGVAELALEEVRPRDLVAEVLGSIGRDDLPVVVAPSAAARIRLDARRIGQVLVNLVQNADNYAGGATELRIEGDADVLRFVVDDAGPGIPLEEREQVFERFVRGADPSVPGTGLGLALVKEHVRLHDGSVWVDTSPQGGARFVVSLPRSRP
ncbi:MAG: HAMP domain-containing sensor histidine kinase [Acidimicrobiales bacterium]